MPTYLTCHGLAAAGFPRAISWTANLLQNVEPIAHSRTRAGTTRICGGKSATLEVVAYGKEPPLNWFPGNVLSFVGSINGSVGLSMAVLVDKLTILWNVVEQKETTYKIEATGIGAWTLGAASISDTSTATPTCPTGTIITRGTTALAGVEKAALVFNAKNKYLFLSGGNGYQDGIPGALDFQLIYFYHPQAMTDIAAPGTVADLNVDGWQLKSAMCIAANQIGGDLSESYGDVVVAEVWGMQQSLTSSDKIVAPSTRQYWP